MEEEAGEWVMVVARGGAGVAILLLRCWDAWARAPVSGREAAVGAESSSTISSSGSLSLGSTAFFLPLLFPFVLAGVGFFFGFPFAPVVAPFFPLGFADDDEEGTGSGLVGTGKVEIGMADAEVFFLLFLVVVVVVVAVVEARLGGAGSGCVLVVRLETGVGTEAALVFG